MKEFTVLLLCAVFVVLITSSVLSVATDDPVDNKIVSEDMDKLNVVPTNNSKFQIYLNVVVRNAQSELISVTETSQCKFGMNCSIYQPHEITDYVFDTLLGKKEIITIDNIKYEKVQWTDTPALEKTRWGDTQGRQIIFMCEISVGHGDQCIPIFQVLVSTMTLEPQGIPSYVTHQWTILRALN